MPTIEVRFPVLGQQLPTDHGYPLYAAVSRLLPDFHKDGVTACMSPVCGQYLGRGRLQIDNKSNLRIRLPAEQIALILPLSGKALDVSGHRIRLGVPSLWALQSAEALVARHVTIKNATDPNSLVQAAREQLDALGVRGELKIPTFPWGERVGEPRRQVIRIKEMRVIGFALHVAGLKPEESLLLQERGLGGRTRMGCGFFLPVKEGE